MGDPSEPGRAPLRRIRQWWCGRQHDKGNRLHSWEMIDDKGSIRCRRCGVVREGDEGGGEFMRDALAKYRSEGWLR